MIVKLSERRILTCLKFGVFRSAGERDDVPDVGHAGDEEEQALETETEARVGHGAVAAGVDVPFEVLAGHSQLVDAGLELLEVRFALGTADDLTDLREEHVHAADGLSVLVLLHVEGLDVLGEVDQDDRLAEVLLHEVALVLALEVGAPVDRVLELLAVRDGLLEDVHGLRVGDALESDAQHAAEPLDQAVVILVVEELQVVHAVVQGVLDEVFHELFGEFHVVVDVVEGHFRLDHPELREVARGVGVLRPEGGAEGVDLAHGGGAELALELAAHGEAGLLAEEVLGEIDIALLVQRDVLEVHRGDLEHVAGALRVGFGDERGMQIDEALVVEELVDSERHRVADAQDGPEGVRPQAHVRDAAQVLQRRVLLLQGEAHRVALADDFDFLGLDFHGLAAADGGDELALHGEGGAGGDALEELLVKEFGIRHDLDIVDGGTVVEGDELHLPVTSLGPDPTFGQHLATRFHPEHFLDLGPFHNAYTCKSCKYTEIIPICLR